MSECDRQIDVDALIDGEAGEDAADIERHIRGCAPCRAYLTDARRNDAMLRRGTRSTMPADLEERLFGPARAPVAPASAQFGRRKILAGLGVAACLGGLGLVLRPLARDPAMADFRTEVLGDFATHIAADRPLDVGASDTDRIVPWISARVPFVLPKRVTPDGTRLLGCRLCWLAGRRLAAFSIEAEGARIGLYIAGAEGLSGLPGEGVMPATAGRDGLQGAFWRDQGLALGIVGAVPASRLAALAATLQG